MKIAAIAAIIAACIAGAVGVEQEISIPHGVHFPPANCK